MMASSRSGWLEGTPSSSARVRDAGGEILGAATWRVERVRGKFPLEEMKGRTGLEGNVGCATGVKAGGAAGASA